MMRMASGMVGVAVNVGGTMGVSDGTGVDVPAGAPPPQPLKTAASRTTRVMNLGRTNFLQKQEVPHAFGVSGKTPELYTLTVNIQTAS